MSDINIRHTILEKENGEGLYIIDFNRNIYIAYTENINIIKNLDEPIADSEELEKLGVYLLKNIREVLNFSEEKAKKIVKYLYYENIIKSKSFKLFILLLQTYIIYYHIFLSAVVKNPILINFFENENVDNRNKTKMEIMKNLFNYLVGIKMLDTKLEISKLNGIFDDLFNIIDRYKNIFNKSIIDSLMVLLLFKEIVKKLIEIKYDENIDINYIEELIKIQYGNINYILSLLSNIQILGGPYIKNNVPPHT